MVFGSFSEALNKYSYERYGHTPEIKQILFYFRYRCFAEPNYWQALLKHSCAIGVLSNISLRNLYRQMLFDQLVIEFLHFTIGNTSAIVHDDKLFADTAGKRKLLFD